MRRRGEAVGFAWSYRDLFITMTVVFLAIAIVVVRSEPKKDMEAAQGVMVIQMTWDMRDDADVDLWVKSPGDVPVGYSRRGGIDCDLLRDDRGRAYDPDSRNEEFVACRRSPAGEWVVNAMDFSSADGRFPIDVVVTVTRAGGNGTPLLTRTAEIQWVGQEVTVVRFALDNDGNLVPESVNDLPMPLRDGGHD